VPHEPAVRRLEVSIDLLELHQAFPARYPHLLQGSTPGRFDILFAFPGESLYLDGKGRLGASGAAKPAGNDFLAGFDRWWHSLARAESEDDDLPFRGGWFVFLGYELAGQIEPGLHLPAADDALPGAIATRFPAAAIYDRRREQTVLVAEPECADLIQLIADDLVALPLRREGHAGTMPGCVIAEVPARPYLDAVARIKRYIRDGDVFQVNLSRRWDIGLEREVADHELFRSLRRCNPGPFSGLATWPRGAVISSSPERLIRVKGRVAETRPIAGTWPRGHTEEVDGDYARELMQHPKERAEHIMLIDLERNDLGRVCEAGSVEVNELMKLESYAHVHHIVSNVRGHLRECVSPSDVIRAVFPGGTITGCPKVRCMEIICELEGEARGGYTGSMGYINRDGSMDLNILIRTMIRSGRHIRVRTGAGIVADSVAERELEETRAKARGLLQAVAAD
jgi:anthranilate synthase component 1